MSELKFSQERLLKGDLGSGGLRKSNGTCGCT
jgi:hypothetical protein